MTDVLTTCVDPADEVFQLNTQAMLRRLAEIGELTAAVNAGGGERAVQRHRDRGRMLIRERIELLIDPHEYFLELSPLAAWDSRFADGASLVTGVGVVAILCSALALLSARSRRAATRGKLLRTCRTCGYDLRATADACPECNTPIPDALRRARDAGKDRQYLRTAHGS